jgi:hypothetical protein
MFTYGLGPFEPQATAEQQVPVSGRLYTQVNDLPTVVTAPAHNGGFVKIRFDRACTITEVGVSLVANYGGATTRQYRLGLYRDNGTGNAPGNLIEDLGLLSIATGATAGFKSLVCASPVSVAAGETIWAATGIATGSTSGLPALYVQTGHLRPYADAGLSATGGGAICWANQTAAAYPATFSAAAEPVSVACVAPYVKVSL